MPTKTDRVLGYLPPTFRPAPSGSALRAFVHAFGSELQQGENELAEVLQSHWVDFADRGASVVADLARLASLYGLARRDDEGVEEFRVHLKRYVRTFLEGTVPVRGILRVTAETLGLTIADGPDDLDSWRTRGTDELVTADVEGADAAPLVLGLTEADARGTAARQAEIAGDVDLSHPVDLGGRSRLYVVVDDRQPVVVDLVAAAADPTAVTLDDIVAAVGAQVGPQVATVQGDRLVMASPTLGPHSRLEVREGPQDAATAVLGLLPLTHRRRAETRAEVTGTIDLSAGVDVSDARYLRIAVDGSQLAEVDCAGPDPAHTFLDHIRDAVNAAFEPDVATHDGHFLTIASPTTGRNSSIVLQPAAAEDGRERLLGPVLPIHTGTDPQPAEVVGSVDLSEGVDLSAAPLLRLRVDDVPTVTVDCRGAIPEHTTLAEVIAAVNAGVGAEVAAADTGRLRLRSPSTGALAEVALDPVSGDAAPALLGIPPRLAEGAAATVAHLTGTAALAGGVNLTARHLLEVAVDGGPFVRIDLRPASGGHRAVSLDALAEAIDGRLGEEVATHDGEHLILRSRHPHGGSRIQVRPITTERARHFVTRAFVTGEANRTLFGVDAAVARGDDASQASVAGAPDLSHGANLAGGRYLRLAVDGAPAVDIDCAGPRPRATLLAQVVDKVNAVVGPRFASHDGRRLTFTSLTVGGTSRIGFETPQAEDAAGLLGLTPATVYGSDGRGVTFVGTADLRQGVDLPAHAAVRVGVDAAPAVDIALTGESAGHLSLAGLASALNVGLGGAFASHDGTHVALVSPSTGAASRLTFEVPATPAIDATLAVFGIGVPRQYHGTDATPARLAGAADVGALDLTIRRFLVVSVDGGPEVAVDCGTRAVDRSAAALADVVDAVNAAVQAPVASVAGHRFVLSSLRQGVNARISISTYTGGDAREVLFGPAVPPVTTGQAPRPAEIVGAVDLLGPADLSSRSQLRVAVDGGAPRDVDVAGASPTQTGLDEIVAAIEKVLPGVASATDDRRLRLASPTTGIASRVELLPLRSLEVVEYPARRAGAAPRALGHGDRLVVDHTGAGPTFVATTIGAPQGSAGPALVNFTRRWLVQLLRPLAAGETARLGRSADGGVQAEVADASGATVAVAGSCVHAGPLGAWAAVPFAGPRPVPATGLQLDNPAATGVDHVLPRRDGTTVEVREPAPDPSFDADRPDGDVVHLVGRLSRTTTGWEVQSGDGNAVRVAAGPDVDLDAHPGAVVAVEGLFHLVEPPYVRVTSVERRFDVTIRGTLADATAASEPYGRVTIGEAPRAQRSLLWQARFGPHPSRLVNVRQEGKGDALLLDRGRTDWLVLDCAGSRFDAARFNHDTFAGGGNFSTGVFDVSLFDFDGAAVTPVFGATGERPPPVDVGLEWAHHEPGAFEVNLPADLPARFGGRFDEATFASAPEVPERYPGVVTEPLGESDSLVDLLNATSTLVRAEPVASLPIGFQSVALPFRRPRHLRAGRGPQHARLYVHEEGGDGFILLQAREQGETGNLIYVASRPAGPARFDVTIGSDGARFESARAVVTGPEGMPVDRGTLEPVALGITQAKAAGVHAAVTRDRTDKPT